MHFFLILQKFLKTKIIQLKSPVFSSQFYYFVFLPEVNNWHQYLAMPISSGLVKTFLVLRWALHFCGFHICLSYQLQIKNIQGKQFSRKFQQVQLEFALLLQLFACLLLCIYSSFFLIIYIVLGITSNLEMIQSVREGMCRLCAKIMSFCTREMNFHRFWYPCGPGINRPQILREEYILYPVM